MWRCRLFAHPVARGCPFAPVKGQRRPSRYGEQTPRQRRIVKPSRYESVFVCWRYIGVRTRTRRLRSYLRHMPWSVDFERCPDRFSRPGTVRKGRHKSRLIQFAVVYSNDQVFISIDSRLSTRQNLPHSLSGVPESGLVVSSRA